MSLINFEKVRNENGQVAVVYSPGFGAGWSTWASTEQKNAMLFHPEIVKAVLENRRHELDEILTGIFGSKNKPYAGGASKTKVFWLDSGTLFDVSEYDGSESIETKERTDWFLA